MTAITEVDGVSWCVEHDSPWYEGDLCCNDAHVLDDCREAPLFYGTPLDATEVDE